LAAEFVQLLHLKDVKRSAVNSGAKHELSDAGNAVMHTTINLQSDYLRLVLYLKNTPTSTAVKNGVKGGA
jgi:hypothetical protein